MQINKEQLYELIKDIKTKKEYEEDIKKIQTEYDQLFDENTASLLIIDELGRNKQNICKISDLKTGEECTVYGQITKINQQRTFNRKNGSNGRVVNLELTDNTGRCLLVLWDKDVELVKNKTIQKGTNVKIINGYVKEGYKNIELNVGRWSIIETEPENAPENIINETIKEDENIIRGKLIEIEPTHAFFKDNGEFGFVTKIKIMENTIVKKISVWDEKVKEIQKYRIGTQIEITNLDTREKNGTKELHLNGRSNIKKL